MGDRIAVLTRSPTTVRDVLDVGLGTPRDQAATRELAEFGRLRTRVYQQIVEPGPASGARRDSGLRASVSVTATMTFPPQLGGPDADAVAQRVRGYRLG